MINTSLKTLSFDSIGMASSTLCLVHCLITPFIFIAQACAASCCETAPVWWRAVDFIFLAISFMAVYFSAKKTPKKWMGYAFYALFIILSTLIINEYVVIYSLSKVPLYAAAILLAGLHFYNRSLSKCSNECCDA
ncbi:MerC domain-containing protein [Carboxylicivirga sp. RSCT41]|uniref:MerC domain-containing protein n=1 Tax=Carboxylicivirga agarovorans TaxID=3417570 RepID=UPI003D33DCD5